ncbi:MAG TPA: hypothetical protein DCE18_09065 [Syntrophobacteraceae bacterium]|nr:hypothetical protein [Syntrophobacteraceae bacterium]
MVMWQGSLPGLNPERLWLIKVLPQITTVADQPVCYDPSKTYVVPAVLSMNCSGIARANAVIASKPVQCVGTT